MTEFDRAARGGWALVTGGSSGIGLALATELRALGAHLHLVARDENRLMAARELLLGSGPGGEVRTHSLDVTDAEGVSGLVRSIGEEDQTPSFVVNSAGRSVPGRFLEQDASELDRSLEVNFLAVTHVLRATLPSMVSEGRGWVLNVASLGGILGVYGMSAYSAAKFALRGFTESLRGEMRPHGIVVSLLSPPDTDTPMLDAERATRPPETEALSGTAGVLDPAHVARIGVSGWRRGRAEIIPGATARGTALAARVAPGLTRWSMDRVVSAARTRSESEDSKR